ncbi:MULTISPECIES: hypothetical protein [unclassified Burkholderia]|uniref:hypothetical protein n=1 Tax=unclassified Burkholderia TaxID=2613784 RepID=UPI000757E0E1|nr:MULTISPECIES: hypothetical protein [unclassified Burkholderia]KVN20661.1 hypothetical protein WT08_28140 [Burkholderia sp. MSMB1552]KWZ46945.1 hypothetical protein WS92_29840 [Burkholderia sp. MSMB1588]
MADTKMRARTTANAVTETVLEQIHFDTLWSTAQDALEVYAGQRWSARDDADPGVTLLQAFSYGVSDVSYRHTLPLTDLLTEQTPPPNPQAEEESPLIHLKHDDGIFAHEFGPEQSLTSSPVTLDDYRRAILDLTVPVAQEDQNKIDTFCFRDVQIAPVAPGDSYGYTYDPNQYAFQFLSDATPEAARYRVSGRYRLWVTLTPGVPAPAAQTALQNYLKDHRNLCEWEIVPEPFVAVVLQQPAVQFVIDDDLPVGDQMNQAIARAIWAINQALLPAPLRQSAADRLAQGEPAEQVYAGPKLEHGWITQLPPRRPVVDGQLGLYTVSLQTLSAAVVGVVPGMKAVQWAGAKQTPIQIPANQQVQMWVSADGKLDQPGQHISIYKRGQKVNPDWGIGLGGAFEQLRKDAQKAEQDSLRQLPYGRYRNPGFYRTVGASLPPVYGLQQAAEVFAPGKDEAARRLLQFLRPVEQLLANSADQLEKLPRLLAFDGRDPNAGVWGAAHWPKREEDPLATEQSQQVFGLDLLTALDFESIHQSQDNEKELAILDYLLGYFGERRALRTLEEKKPEQATSAVEFRLVQQGFLRQVTRLAYDRAAISISKVSALQRKIAARLGVGSMLFDEILQQKNARFPQEALPFYVIEHQELLPGAPAPGLIHAGADWPKNQTVKLVSISTDEKDLTLVLDNAGSQKLQPGQLIELQAQDLGDTKKFIEPITAIVIHKVDICLNNDAVSVHINLSDHVRLKRSIKILQDTAHYIWHWRLAQTWLKRVVYELDYSDKAHRDTDPQVELRVIPSFPVEFTAGQRFALRPKVRWQSVWTTADLQASASLKDVVVEVVAANPIQGTVTVKWIADLEVEQRTTDPLRVDPVNLTTTKRTNANWSLTTTNPKYLYAWSVPYGTESFSFTLSVVLNRAWLEGSENPAELSRWIEQIVREEMPSHLNLQIHWLNDFGNFATKYRIWQNDGRPVGDQSYELLRLLGIGERPVDQRSGIGFVRVATQDESKAYTDYVKGIKILPERRSYLQNTAVIYVEQKANLENVI